jgi:hypothetical protein
MRVSGCLFPAILFVAIIIIPLASANDSNVTPATTPFITIDPVGNPAAGEVFVIKGTTNLLPVIDTLHLVITPTTFNPGGFGSDFQTTVPIQRGEKDINFWSCTVPTTTGWLSFQPPGRSPTDDARPDNYMVTVESSTDGNVSQFQIFDMVPAGTDTDATISPAPAPFIKIDPVGNHTVGDVFFINGTTNLAASDNSLSLDISWADFNPGGFGTSFYMSDVSIQPGEPGINRWSAEVVPSRWEMYTEPPPYHPTPMFGKIRPGKYAVYISSRDAMVSNDAAPVFFYIFPESRITLFQTAMTPPAFSSPPSPSPTQSSPISALLPVVVFVIMLVLRFVLKER